MVVSSLNPNMRGFIPKAGRVAFTSRNGMVASAHPLSSLAGLRVLLDGGNAIDAIVATAAALNVVEPNMSGALGVGQMLVLPGAGAEPVALDFGGRSPHAASADAFAGEVRIPQDDIRSAVVPANLAGWLAALERFGSMDRARIFREAIGYAAQGFPLTEGNAGWIASNQARVEKHGSSRRFYAQNPTPAAGAIFRQPQLAETYQQFADEGSSALYGGTVGDEVARYCREHGGLIGRGDLAEPRVRWTTPIKTHFRDSTVYTMPSPSMGIQTLLTLNLMEGFDNRKAGHNSARYLHTLIEAIKLASVDRAEYAARIDLPKDALLAKHYAAERRALIRDRRAAASPGERWSGAGDIVAGRPGDPGHTTYLCAVDAAGNAVSMTQSLGNAFGCGAIAGETGLFLNDFGWWFDLNPESPNYIRPDTPVEQCLSPCMVLERGQLKMTIGTPGGHGIPQTSSQMLLNILDFGMEVQEAIEAPRVRVFAGHHVDIESRVEPHIRAELEGYGHALTVLPPYFWGVGGGQGIRVEPDSGAFIGGADPRRDGYVMGW